MDSVINLLTYFVTISVAAERIVEILKNTILKDKVHNPAVYQSIAAVVGMASCYFSKLPIAFQMPEWMQIIITGAAVSGGSGFWNSILEMMVTFKKSIAATKTS